jgi:hypothetical protein
LTRTGDPNDPPASVLTAEKMSVEPSGPDALQASATRSPSAAIEGVAFARPAMPTSIDVDEPRATAVLRAASKNLDCISTLH